MNEVYRILRKFNFEWKVLSLYKLKARYPAGLVDRQGKPVSSSEVCKIGIQLYKTSGRDAGSGGAGMAGASNTSSSSNTPTQSPALGPSNPLGVSQSGVHASYTEPQGAFVLDMQKLCGQMFLFDMQNLFSAILEELAPLSRQRPPSSHPMMDQTH